MGSCGRVVSVSVYHSHDPGSNSAVFAGHMSFSKMFTFQTLNAFPCMSPIVTSFSVTKNKKNTGFDIYWKRIPEKYYCGEPLHYVLAFSTKVNLNNNNYTMQDARILPDDVWSKQVEVSSNDAHHQISFNFLMDLNGTNQRVVMIVASRNDAGYRLRDANILQLPLVTTALAFQNIDSKLSLVVEKVNDTYIGISFLIDDDNYHFKDIVSSSSPSSLPSALSQNYELVLYKCPSLRDDVCQKEMTWQSFPKEDIEVRIISPRYSGYKAAKAQNLPRQISIQTYAEYDANFKYGVSLFKNKESQKTFWFQKLYSFSATIASPTHLMIEKLRVGEKGEDVEIKWWYDQENCIQCAYVHTFILNYCIIVTDETSCVGKPTRVIIDSIPNSVNSLLLKELKFGSRYLFTMTSQAMSGASDIPATYLYITDLHYDWTKSNYLAVVISVLVVIAVLLLIGFYFVCRACKRCRRKFRENVGIALPNDSYHIIYKQNESVPLNSGELVSDSKEANHGSKYRRHRNSSNNSEEEEEEDDNRNTDGYSKISGKKNVPVSNNAVHLKGQGDDKLGYITMSDEDSKNLAYVKNASSVSKSNYLGLSEVINDALLSYNDSVASIPASLNDIIDDDDDDDDDDWKLPRIVINQRFDGFQFSNFALDRKQVNADVSEPIVNNINNQIASVDDEKVKGDDADVDYAVIASAGVRDDNKNNNVDVISPVNISKSTNISSSTVSNDNHTDDKHAEDNNNCKNDTTEVNYAIFPLLGSSSNNNNPLAEQRPSTNPISEYCKIPLVHDINSYAVLSSDQILYPTKQQPYDNNHNGDNDGDGSSSSNNNNNNNFIFSNGMDKVSNNLNLGDQGLEYVLNNDISLASVYNGVRENVGNYSNNDITMTNYNSVNNNKNNETDNDTNVNYTSITSPANYIIHNNNVHNFNDHDDIDYDDHCPDDDDNYYDDHKDDNNHNSKSCEINRNMSKNMSNESNNGNCYISYKRDVDINNILNNNINNNNSKKNIVNNNDINYEATPHYITTTSLTKTSPPSSLTSPTSSQFSSSSSSSVPGQSLSSLSSPTSTQESSTLSLASGPRLISPITSDYVTLGGSITLIHNDNIC
ncbi:hypothetical protein HELRODRAFT_159493 [Helobdella robusta]|uniref:Fibronectin type-III domain-containing protein n=1 Tax=Helobdella robusta TaxID=6412 RepID=T1EP35_HELRO|nr:hypothetical protein HELRODRAFT_159493 [Helobdella robusta]ESO12906.1 hypothetical protein HELRODRAFT_159493 [Helobdella robusta]